MRITKPQLAGLDQYKYSGVDRSIVSRHILGPFWTWLVTLFPKSLAPNTVRPVLLPALPAIGCLSQVTFRGEESACPGGRGEGRGEEREEGGRTYTRDRG